MQDGVYAAYLTGLQGNSLAIILFKDGILAGADLGGGRYDGSYSESSDGKWIEGKITFLLPAGGGQTITGVEATGHPLSVDVEIRLPVDFTKADVHELATPLGPINMILDKLREL